MKSLLVLLIAVVSSSAHATLQFGWTNGVNATFANGGVVPDNNLSGWSDTRTLGSISGTIQDVSVRITITGGWNGDLYAYLLHSSQNVVLFDRVGYSGSGSGYGNTGFDIVLTGSGNPIETYQNFSPTYSGTGQLLGSWQAHGNLGTYAGLDPNGTWSLFIADYSGGGVSTVTSWGLDLNIVAVPEVETWVAAALAGLFGAFWLNRQIWGPKRA